jgi:hypothetical protein
MRAALGSLSSERLDRGETISAWVIFDPAGTITSHVNASSITDNGGGDWTVNWAVPFSNADWCVVGAAVGTTNVVTVAVKASVALTPTSVNIVTGGGTGVVQDPTGSPELFVGGIGH